MAVKCDQVKSYATQFLPQFVFGTSERVFPVTAESYLTQCAEDDWTDTASPHMGTAVIVTTTPLEITELTAMSGCHGTAGNPIDPSQPLAFRPGSPEDESFLDFGGWPSLTTGDGFTTGNDDYIRRHFSTYFAKFNGALAMGEQPPPTRTPAQLPDKMAIYCEAAWAGDFTRLAIKNQLGDFASPATNNPNQLTPDPRLDPYFVLTYYLFYPCTEPPPPTSTFSPSSPNQLFREGQWEAVSFYFKSTNDVVNSANGLALAADPAKVTPDHVVLSQGITRSGDGFQGAGLANSYPAQPGSWSQGGQVGGPPHGISGGRLLEQQSVFVTEGTHKNLFSPTPTATTSSSDPAWAATGGALEGAGGTLAGTGLGATPIGWPLIIIGALLFLAGFLMQLFGKDDSTSQLPDSSGDTATSNGPVANPGATPTDSGAPSVDIDLKVFSALPDNVDCQPPAWWSYPGRWGVAMSSGAAGWDSGGRRIDFKGRSRAYWNTVWLQTTLS
jgi:hypothetical protein